MFNLIHCSPRLHVPFTIYQIQVTQCPTADQQWDKRGEVSRISGVGGGGGGGGGEGGLRKILRWVERPGEKPYTVL